MYCYCINIPNQLKWRKFNQQIKICRVFMQNRRKSWFLPSLYIYYIQLAYINSFYIQLFILLSIHIFSLFDNFIGVLSSIILINLEVTKEKVTLAVCLPNYVNLCVTIERPKLGSWGMTLLQLFKNDIRWFLRAYLIQGHKRHLCITCIRKTLK